jgi:predicted RNA-binding Zn-ribbon protein involved in translation (DUF1610 family)
MVASRGLALAVTVALFLALLLMGAPSGTAGTADAPEITDPGDDQKIGGTVPACAAGECGGGARIDVLKAWIDAETADQFNVNIDLASAPGGAAGASGRWEFHATYAGTEVISIATAQGGASTGAPVAGANTASVTVGGNVLTMTILKSVYGTGAPGTGLTNIFIEGESQTPPPSTATTYINDRAPDSGGVAYTFAGAGGPAAPIFTNVTDEVFEETVSSSNGTSGTYHYNWTQGPSNATVSYNATGTGNVTLIITDANGTELRNETLEAPTNGTFTIENATAGDWTVRYVFGNFTGNFTARIAPGLDAGNGTGNQTGGGSGTSTGTSTGGSGTSTGTGTGTQGKGGNGTGEETDEALLDKLTSDPAYLYTSAGGFAVVTLNEKPASDASMEAKLARYRHLRANVRRRRRLYGLFIVLAIVTLAVTVVDILFLLEEDWNADAVPVGGQEFGLIQVVAYALYVILFVFAVFLLFSRRQHIDDLRELAVLEKTYLSCENCNGVFQFGQLNLNDRKRIGFSCPICGEESALPGLDAVPIEMPLPAGTPAEAHYNCSHCGEEIAVATFGAAPKSVSFRACPHCGKTGRVEPGTRAQAA